MQTQKLQMMGGSGPKTFSHFQGLEQLQRAGELENVAVMTAMERRKMAAEVFVLMINDNDGVLTPDEIQEVWKEADYQEWATGNGDGTFTLTEAGRQLIAAPQKG